MLIIMTSSKCTGSMIEPLRFLLGRNIRILMVLRCSVDLVAQNTVRGLSSYAENKFSVRNDQPLLKFLLHTLPRKAVCQLHNSLSYQLMASIFNLFEPSIFGSAPKYTTFTSKHLEGK